MSSPRSIRLEPRVLEKLASYAARHPGVSSSGAAARFVDEGLRMADHPGIAFRDGPAGRRAVLLGGPDVWEVVRAIRAASAAEPTLATDAIVGLVAETAGVSTGAVEGALDYYGEYPEEVEAMLIEADRAEADLERARARTAELLGR